MADRRVIQDRRDYWLTEDTGQIIGAGVSGDSAQPSIFQRQNSSTKTASATIKNADTHVRGNATGGALVFTLPLTPTNGQRHTVKKVDSSVNTVTIGGNGRNIDGASTNVISVQYASISVFYDFSSNTWNIE